MTEMGTMSMPLFTTFLFLNPHKMVTFSNIYTEIKVFNQADVWSWRFFPTVHNWTVLRTNSPIWKSGWCATIHRYHMLLNSGKRVKFPFKVFDVSVLARSKKNAVTFSFLESPHNDWIIFCSHNIRPCIKHFTNFNLLLRRLRHNEIMFTVTVSIDLIDNY